MIFLYIFIYLLVGGFVIAVATQFEFFESLYDDEILFGLILILHPIFVGMCCVAGIAWLVFKAGEALGQMLQKWIGDRDDSV